MILYRLSYAFLRILNELVARLPPAVSGIRRDGSTGEVSKVCRLCEESDDTHPSRTLLSSKGVFR